MPSTAHPAAASPLRELGTGVAQTGRIAAALLVSWVLPERLWRPITFSIARAVVWLRPGWKREQLQELRDRLGLDSGAGLKTLTDRISLGHESRLYGLREYRPGQVEHRVRLSGAEIIHEGLAQARGVILWVAPFVFGSLVTKIALKQAGFVVSHLSRPTHGFSESRFGVRWLNPIWTKVEERYVSRRIVMHPSRQITALRDLTQRLANNEVISITVGDEGIQTVTVPFLQADLCLATGPITLAAATGAWLVPVFTVRDSSRRFVVEVQSHLDVPTQGSRDQRTTLVAERYAARLAPFARDHAGQWLG